MTDALAITVTCSQDPIPANSPPRLLYVLFEIRLGEMGAAPPALPVNIAIVVDKSDSMSIPMLSPDQFEKLAQQGGASEMIVDGMAVWRLENVPASLKIDAPRSIDFVKRALCSALEQLTPHDRFALVAFAREACVLVPHQSGEAKRALLPAIEKLDTLQLGNETFLGAGMTLGYEQVQQAYSRGMVNRMIVLTDGFTLDDPQCRVLAQQAAQAGISISTMGLGVEFNEELLISIADSSGGNAYFIRDPAEIPEAFTQELSGVQNVWLRDVNLKMRFMPGVVLRRVHRVKPIISDVGAQPISDRSFDLALGDLGRNGEIALLFEVQVPRRSEGAHLLAHSIVEYDQPGLGLFGEKARQNCTINYAVPANAAINPRVMNIIEKVSAFKLQTRALEEASRGDKEGATQKLKAAATRLINMGEHDLAQAALSEVANLEKSGKISAEGTKRLRYETRRLTR